MRPVSPVTFVIYHILVTFAHLFSIFYSPQVRKALYLAEQRDREQEQSSKRPRRAASKGRGGKGKKNSARQSTEDSDGDSEQGDDVGLDLDA